MNVTVKLEGDEKLLAEFKRSAKGSESVVRTFVSMFVLDIHSRAVKGIQGGPATGRVYNKYLPRRVHQASAVGQYPMSDTGRLASSVIKELPRSAGKPEGQVGSNLDYAKYLEMKPEATGGRPWLFRAFREATTNPNALLRRLLSKEAKK